MFDSRPLISVGIPVYNGERFIRRALESLLGQYYERCEFIVSDNASTDRTAEILREYAANDGRIRLYQNESNMGGLANFRRVLYLARGQYFMWAAHDDQWHPEFVSALLTDLDAHPEAGVAMSAANVVADDGMLLKTVRFEGSFNPNGLDYHQMLLALMRSGKRKRKYNYYIYGLFRAEFLRQATQRFPNTFLNDRLFLCQVALATRFRYVDRVLYTKTVHKASAAARYPDEQYSRVQMGHDLLRFQLVFDLAWMLLTSSAVPVRRKVYIPEAMWCLAGFLWRTLQRERRDRLGARSSGAQGSQLEPDSTKVILEKGR